MLIGSGKVVSGQAERSVICREAVAMADDATDASDLVWASIAAQYGGDEVGPTRSPYGPRLPHAHRASSPMLPYALEFKSLAELYASRFAGSGVHSDRGLSLARGAPPGELHRQAPRDTGMA